MTREEVKARIKEIIAEQILGKYPNEDLETFLTKNRFKINDDTHIVDDLGADSLDTVELVMELEGEFDINIGDDEAEKIRRFHHFVDAVWQKIS